MKIAKSQLKVAAFRKQEKEGKKGATDSF